MSKKKSVSQKILWPTVGIIVVGGIVWLAVSAPKRPASSITTREVALTCTTDMATQFHVHAQMKITVNGVPQDIPSNIGVAPQCMNPLHTHDAKGEIHVESPEKRDFSLADFFAVWGKTFTSTQILDQKVDDLHVIHVTVNGKTVETYENTIINDNNDIVISYEEKK
jgi:hypothetical protein